MSNLSFHIRRLVEAGADPCIAAEVAADIFVAGVESAPLRVDEAAERRREKDRLYQQERRDRIVGRCRQTSAESADGEPAKKVPPITPLKKQTPLSEANASSVPKPKKGGRLPDDWQPTESLFLFGSELGFSRETSTSEFDRFRDHFRAASGSRGVKSDWDATARNWLRRAVEMRGPKPNYVQTGARNAKPENLSDTARRLAASGVTFGERPRPIGLGANGDNVRMLPARRSE